MIEKQKQKISFLASISQEEWFLNGHCVKNGEEYKLMYLFESLIRQIKGGKFLELGCGTGLLSKYIYLFFKDVIPYGVDINRKFIARAKENNFKIKNNFTISDFFILPPAFFKKYSTIAVFMGRRKNEKDDWIKLGKLVKKCLRDNKEACKNPQRCLHF